jgi:ankyrin repeat protein
MSQINAGQSNGQKKIEELTYQEVLYFLSPLSDQQMNYSNKLLFKQAIKLVNEYNVNTLETNDSFSLTGYAAGLNNIKTIKYLLKRHSNDLQPQNLSDAILAAAEKGHDKALKLLLSNKKILKQAIEKHSLNLRQTVCFLAKNGYDKTLRILVSNDEVINAIKSQSTSNGECSGKCVR